MDGLTSTVQHKFSRYLHFSLLYLSDLSEKTKALLKNPTKFHLHTVLHISEPREHNGGLGDLFLKSRSVQLKIFFSK